MSFLLPQYIDETLPAESPYLYGLHPNAEIGVLTQTSEKLFRIVLEMQPRDGGLGEGGGMTREEKVKSNTLESQSHAVIRKNYLPSIFICSMSHSG